MDLREVSKFKGGAIDQYTPPLCFELAGERLELAMDDGYDFVLDFISKDKLQWNWVEEAPKTEEYKCLKADDTTYLVSYELADVKPRVNHTFVIDKENMLVTRVIASIGKNPRWPYLMKTEFEFGAIRVDGAEVKPYPRHGYTSDLIGNIVQWTYGSELSTVHVYYCGNFYRITYPRVGVTSEAGAQMNETFAEILKALPSADEPTVYIKIKDGVYLTSLTEANGEKVMGAKMMFRSNTLCFLQNYKRCYDVGRGFGTSTLPDGTDTETHVMIGAYGRIIDATDEGLLKMLNDPNPYLT
jgi:hypothetical protein